MKNLGGDVVMVIIGPLIAVSAIASFIEGSSTLSGGSAASEAGRIFADIAFIILGICLFIGGMRGIRAKRAKEKKLQ